MIRLDWVSLAGIFATFHVGLVFLVIPAFVFVARPWSKKILSLYFITAALFYGVLIFGVFKGEKLPASAIFLMFIFGAIGFFLSQSYQRFFPR